MSLKGRKTLLKKFGAQREGTPGKFEGSFIVLSWVAIVDIRLDFTFRIPSMTSSHQAST